MEYSICFPAEISAAICTFSVDYVKYIAWNIQSWKQNTISAYSQQMTDENVAGRNQSLNDGDQRSRLNPDWCHLLFPNTIFQKNVLRFTFQLGLFQPVQLPPSLVLV